MMYKIAWCVWECHFANLQNTGSILRRVCGGGSSIPYTDQVLSEAFSFFTHFLFPKSFFPPQGVWTEPYRKSGLQTFQNLKAAGLACTGGGCQMGVRANDLGESTEKQQWVRPQVLVCASGSCRHLWKWFISLWQCFLLSELRALNRQLVVKTSKSFL